MAVFGAGYSVVGVGILHAARHVGNPFHFVLIAIGWLLAAAGVWCLLWFAGIAALVGILGTRHWERNWRVLLVIVFLFAYAADWWFFWR